MRGTHKLIQARAKSVVRVSSFGINVVAETKSARFFRLLRKPFSGWKTLRGQLHDVEDSAINILDYLVVASL